MCGLGFWLAGRAAMGEHPSLVLISAWLTLSNFTATLLAMAVESLMAATIPDDRRGSAGGWSQAGNLGGQGLGGGLSLWLIESRRLQRGAVGRRAGPPVRAVLPGAVLGRRHQAAAEGGRAMSSPPATWASPPT